MGNEISCCCEERKKFACKICRKEIMTDAKDYCLKCKLFEHPDDSDVYSYKPINLAFI